MSKRFSVRAYPGFGLFSLLFFIYLYLPIAVVVFYSFNANRIVSNWGGFSLAWYGAALSNGALLDAVRISLIVAAIATAISTTVALMAALVIVRGRNVRFRRVSETVVNLPLLLPEIVVAVAVLILFSELGIANGLVKLVIAHTTFCIPFAFLPIRARLQGMDADLEEAARDLYASGWVAFRRVTLPLITGGPHAGLRHLHGRFHHQHAAELRRGDDAAGLYLLADPPGRLAAAQCHLDADHDRLGGAGDAGLHYPAPGIGVS